MHTIGLFLWMRLLLAGALSFLFFPVMEASQYSHFYFRSLGVEDGLSQNMVYAVLQDRKGFMWFGTQNGLNRYDGHSFRVFKREVRNERGLKSDAIFSLAEDSDGILWVGTDIGVFLYDPVSDCFSTLPVASGGGTGMIGVVRTIVRDKDDNMWLGAGDRGVACVTSRKSVRIYPLDPYLSKGQGIRSLCPDMDGNLWIAVYQQGVLKLNPATGKLERFSLSDGVENTVSNDVNCLFLLDSETMLAGTVGRGLLKLNLRDGSFDEVLSKGEDGKPLFVRQICTDANGNLWVGTESGLYICPWQNGQLVADRVEHFEHLFSDPYSLSDNAVHSICRDREGGMWLGTFFGGVNYFTEFDARFEKYYPVAGEYSLSGKSISEFCEDARGRIWVGTEDGGVNCFDPSARSFTRGTVPAKNIHGLLCDGDNLWIGSFSEGLFVLNLQNGRVKNYRSSSAPDALRDDNVYALYKDYTGTVWVGTMTGLHRYIRGEERFESIREGEISSQVNDILEDFDGILWFATLGQGLFSYDRKTDRWEHYPTVVTEDATRGKMVVCLLEDSRHRLWIGTEGAGMVRYDKQTHTFTDVFSMERGLPNNIVYQLLEDAEGGIWGSTNKGLFRLDPSSGGIRTWTHSEGLLGDQFNYKSGFVSRSGKMYFGGVKGFVAFEPDKVVLPANTSGNIVFNSFQIDNVEVRAGGEDGLLRHSIAYTRQITLPYNRSVFSLGFAALNYAGTRGVCYAYKLEGWDQDWIYAGNVRQATYSNLSPGRYTFRVKVTDGDRMWKEGEADMAIYILPPFYLTVWAFLIYAVLLVLLVYAGIRVYTHRLQKRNAEAMKQLEHSKERELYDAKICFFTNITHEIRTPLSLIKAPLEEVIKDTPHSDRRYDLLSIIERNADRLLRLVNELLDFRKVEAQGLQLNFVQVDVREVVGDVVRRFAPTAGLKKIAFREELPAERLTADVDEEVLTKVLSNLLSNALKHAQTYIRICLEREEECFRLVVMNDGDRIPAEQVERIFEPFVKLDENSVGTGIGLPLARALVEAHGGRIFVDTERSDVAFVMVLPFRQAVVMRLDDDMDEVAVDEAVREADSICLPEAGDREVVLSVEDNEEFQHFMAGQLTADYRVVKATNGEEALRILSEQNVDLVISDVMMPVMDGMRLCREIKENIRYSHIPVILLTAKSGLQARLDGLKTGADEYIAKPYSIEYLRVRIANLLENRRKIRESYRHSPESTIDVIAHSKADEEFLNKLVEAIHSRLEEVNLDVDTLALMMNMSRATLYRKVKSISELTPNDFIRLIRLKKAAELLGKKEYRINEIAFIVGFSSSSYFSKCFYRQFGVLPKDFGKNLKK